MGQRTSVYLDDDLSAAVKAAGVPLAELVRRGLAASTAPAESRTAVRDPPAAPSPAPLPESTARLGSAQAEQPSCKQPDRPRLIGY